MTTPQLTPEYAQFGQALAFAERTMTEVLREHLAERQIRPATWYALKLIARGGPGATREAVTRDLESNRTANAGSVRELLARMAADGLIQGTDTIALTSAGHALHDDLREYVSRPTIQLLSRFDAADIATTTRTLLALAEMSVTDQEPRDASPDDVVARSAGVSGQRAGAGQPPAEQGEGHLSHDVVAG